MRSKAPVKPEGIDAPGLQWRPRKDGEWVAYWRPTEALARSGAPIKVHRIWSSSGGNHPTQYEWGIIASHCVSLYNEMLGWMRSEQPRPNHYDGTLRSLAALYQTDPDSPYRKLRYHTMLSYDSKLETLVAAIGGTRLEAVTFRDFQRYYEAARTDADGSDRASRAHGLMTMIRIIVSFGCLLEIDDCLRVHTILSRMEFQLPKRRTQFLTAAMADAIRAKAHAMGYPSIALAQALQFELTMRQKDVIGEWIPQWEPGVSDIVAGARKWFHGIRWSDVNQGILRKRISKSLRGRQAVLQEASGKVEEFDLMSYPMIVEELGHIPQDKRVGPMVVCEYTGLPWRQKVFAAKWREIARAAGIPDAIQNRDSRAGGITEATDAGADFESVRRHAGHSQQSMTARYSRAHVEIKNKVERIRVESRKKPK